MVHNTCGPQRAAISAGCDSLYEISPAAFQFRAFLNQKSPGTFLPGMAREYSYSLQVLWELIALFLATAEPGVSIDKPPCQRLFTINRWPYSGVTGTAKVEAKHEVDVESLSQKETTRSEC